MRIKIATDRAGLDEFIRANAMDAPASRRRSGCCCCPTTAGGSVEGDVAADESNPPRGGPMLNIGYAEPSGGRVELYGVVHHIDQSCLTLVFGRNRDDRRTQAPGLLARPSSLSAAPALDLRRGERRAENSGTGLGSRCPFR